MPAKNTDELAVLVKDWLNREDLDTVIPTFIQAADSRVLSDPRARGEMTQQVVILDRNESLEMVNPVPITTRYVAEWGGFYDATLDPTTDAQPDEEQLTEETYDYEYLNVFVDDEEYTRVTIDEFYNEEVETGGNQKRYTVIGGRLYIEGFPDIDPTFTSGVQAGQEPYVLRLIVFRKDRIDFDEALPTSELLRNIPMAYLYGTLVEAAVYLRDVEGIQIYQARYEEFMDKLYKDYKRKQVSAGWSVGSVGGDYYFDRSY